MPIVLAFLLFNYRISLVLITYRNEAFYIDLLFLNIDNYYRE
jgi:hypothetical protein